MKRISILSGLAVSLLALPAMAQETVYTTVEVPLEAGPAPDYPVVGTFGAGTPLTLYGCLDGYTWCDVSYADARGWVDGQELAFPYQDESLPIAVYGPQLSLPLITFSFDNYWGEHYHDRPFFRERDRFERHAPPPPPPHRDVPRMTPRGRPFEGRPGGNVPVPGPHPGEYHPQEQPHPQGQPHPQEQPHPQAQPQPRPQPQQQPHPQPQPAARPPEQQRPAQQPAQHPAEEHHEPPGEQPHQ